MANEPSRPLRVLVLGASYGVLLGMRIAAAGHSVTFVCRRQEANLINAGNLFLHVPAKDQDFAVEIGPSQCPVPPDAAVPRDVDPQQYDLVCLAMAEPQYSSDGVRELINRIATAGIPCLSIMNMPLPPFLDKVEALGSNATNSVFTEASLWSQFDPSVFTMASADPQAMRVDDDDALTISVTLPTNFKVAPFDNPQHQRALERLASDIDATRLESHGMACTPRVRLRPHTSLHIPLAKWPMLITGNFRCMTNGEPISISDAVCGSEAESREIYDWVTQVCLAVGVDDLTLVPFDRYLSAARGLSLPSSLARGLYAGATAVERIDMLIHALAARYDMTNSALDLIIGDVSARLDENRI